MGCKKDLDFFPPWPWSVACGVFIPQPGIKPMFLAVEARSLNHWTIREVRRTWTYNLSEVGVLGGLRTEGVVHNLVSTGGPWLLWEEQSVGLRVGRGGAATGGPGRRPRIWRERGPFRLHSEVEPTGLASGRGGRREAGGVLWSESGV